MRKISAGGARRARPEQLDAWPSTAPSRCAPRRSSASPRPSRRAASAAKPSTPATGWPRRRCSSRAARERGAPPVVRAFDARALEQQPRRRRVGGDGRRRARSSAAARPCCEQEIVVVDPETLAPCARRRGRRDLGRGAERRARLLEPARGDRARPSARASPDTGEGPFLRTGDLGFLDDGELFVTGPPQRPHHHPRPQPLPAGHRADGRASAPGAAPGLRRGLLGRGGGRGAAGRRAGGRAARRRADARRRLSRSMRQARRRGARGAGCAPSCSQGRERPEDFERQDSAPRLPRGVPRAASFDVARASGARRRRSRSAATPAAAPAPRDCTRRRGRRGVAAREARGAGSASTRPRLTPTSRSRATASTRWRRSSSRTASRRARRRPADDELLCRARASRSSPRERCSTRLRDEALAPPRAMRDADARTRRRRAPALARAAGALVPAPARARERGLQHRRRARASARALDADALRRAFQRSSTATPRCARPSRVATASRSSASTSTAEVCFERTTTPPRLDEAELRERLMDEAHRPFDLERGAAAARQPLHARGRRARPPAGRCTTSSPTSGRWPCSCTSWARSTSAEVRGRGRDARAARGAVRGLRALAGARCSTAPEGERLWDYWREQLGGRAARARPADRPAAPARADLPRRVARRSRSAPELTARLKALGRDARRDALHDAARGLPGRCSHRYTGQDDIVVGSPDGRAQPRGAGAALVGYFVNPSCCAQTSRATRPSRQLLGAVRRDACSTPSSIRTSRSRCSSSGCSRSATPSRSPLFQVMFVLQKAHAARRRRASPPSPSARRARASRSAGSTLESLRARTARRAVRPDAVDGRGRRRAARRPSSTTQTSSSAATVERMAGHFATLLEDVRRRHPAARLASCRC